jgi:hypothetical protein
MATPVVAGTVALMMQANPNLTPNLVKAILQFTSQEYPGYDPLTQGTGFLNARGAVLLAEYFRNHVKGSPYPSMNGWSRQIFWGNKRMTGGVLTPGGTAWQPGLVWGSVPQGLNIVWGENCPDSSCDNIVWGNNIVWGDSTDDGDNIVWGNTDGDNIVWGNSDGDNIVWGNSDGDNIVWGNSDGDNIVWGNGVSQTAEQIAFDAEAAEVNSLPSVMWDALFPLDAQWPVPPPPVDPPPAPPVPPPPPPPVPPIGGGF